MAGGSNSFWEYALGLPATSDAWGTHVSLIRRNVLAPSRVGSLDDLRRHARDFRLEVEDADLVAIWQGFSICTLIQPGGTVD